VIQKRFREPGDPIPGIPRPFMTPEEIARGEISRKKKKDFIAGVVASNPIDLPENFDLDLEEQERALGGE
jgi:hypothetical protein